MASTGMGLDLSDATSEKLVGVFIGSIATFMLIFVGIMWKQSNEVVIARRAIWWVRISYAILLACAALQICFEAEIAQSLTFPMYGGARPTAHLLVIFMGFFVNSHHCFRWLTIMAQCVFIIFDTFSVAHIDLQLQCRSNGTCESTDGWSVMDLTVIQVRHYVALWFEIWTVLITAYLMFVIGICWPRYPVRMFSSSQPLSVLPGGRTQYGRIHAANAKLDTI